MLPFIPANKCTQVYQSLAPPPHYATQKRSLRMALETQCRSKVRQYERSQIKTGQCTKFARISVDETTETIFEVDTSVVNEDLESPLIGPPLGLLSRTTRPIQIKKPPNQRFEIDNLIAPN